jgi:hypothetical protein
VKKYNNDNPMPQGVYDDMTQYHPSVSMGMFSDKYFDLHHALVDKGDVKGMPLSERKKIHDIRNLWWVRSEDHASHANIASKQDYYRLLCARFGKHQVDAFVRSFNWKSTPVVTVEWLEQ